MEPHGQARGPTPNAPWGRTSRTRGPIHPRVNPWSSWCWDRIDPRKVSGPVPAVMKGWKKDIFTQSQQKRPIISDGPLIPAFAEINLILGNVLLSHTVTHAVPSALKGLTSVFGMGTGVSPPPWSPRNFKSVSCKSRGVSGFNSLLLTPYA
jgi:hypothetical protein